MRDVLILGASGSIGEQSLDIIKENKSSFNLTAISVGNNSDYLISTLKEFPSIKYAYLIDEEVRLLLSNAFPNVTFFAGKNGLRKMINKCSFDLCVDALVGFVGMAPAIQVLKKNKILCLANKEALVSGGTIINKLLSKGKGKLYPIDSEHVALAKCLSKVNLNDVKTLHITASGGALRNMRLEDLENATPEDALKHPNWTMGKKITIDCATMMNKGFEIIEAYYLFHFPVEQISVQMHDESLIHSYIELKDGTLIYDYGKPDMHNPIKYAMFEGLIDFKIGTTKDLSSLVDCHFHDYDPERYPLTELAKQCLMQGASKMIALNAANEVAVNRFLNKDIKYLDIKKIVQTVVEKQRIIKAPSLMEINYIDKKARKEANKL